MKMEYIKPIPKYILERIKRYDNKCQPLPSGHNRYYAYLTIWHKELIKVTVAVRNYRKKWFCKQVAIHGLHSDKCYIKDFVWYRMSGYKVGWYEEGISRVEKWYEGDGWGWNDDKYLDPPADIINYEVMNKLPEFKYSAYELYEGYNLLKYLRLYEQYPALEYLMKLGIKNHAMSKQILEKTTKDRTFRKWIAKNRFELINNYYSIPAIIRAYNKGVSLSQAQSYINAKKELASFLHAPFVNKRFGDNPHKLLDYIGKQNTNMLSYRDYIEACEYLGLDLNDSKNLLPNDFHRWHDIRIDEMHSLQAQRDAEERKKLNVDFALVADKYIALQHNKRSTFVCIIAKSIDDLINEGDTLHHCVGRMHYDQKFLREESLIFFIRNKEEPNIPLVTVEYSLKNHKVLQCYGDHDSRPNAEIMHYVNDVWLPYANKQIKRLAA